MHEPVITLLNTKEGTSLSATVSSLGLCLINSRNLVPGVLIPSTQLGTSTWLSMGSLFVQYQGFTHLFPIFQDHCPPFSDVHCLENITFYILSVSFSSPSACFGLFSEKLYQVLVTPLWPVPIHTFSLIFPNPFIWRFKVSYFCRQLKHDSAQMSDIVSKYFRMNSDSPNICQWNSITYASQVYLFSENLWDIFAIIFTRVR
jgi:hypothetical protein